ncbi:MAG: flavodoxin family protein [Thermoplasmata archaeon]|nr:MAG: flavodoxin family protein [Thermoplasmata archaeon]
MKSLIICKSIHVGNTEKIAKRMAKVLDADVIEPKETEINSLKEFDLIGFGSGIYSYKHHGSLLNLADKLPDLHGKKVFVFSTSGVIMNKFHDDLKQKLERKNAVIVDEFFCKGFNKNSFLKYIGGMNKGRPNEKDFKSAEAFVMKIKEEVEKDIKSGMQS